VFAETHQDVQTESKARHRELCLFPFRGENWAFLGRKMCFLPQRAQCNRRIPQRSMDPRLENVNCNHAKTVNVFVYTVEVWYVRKKFFESLLLTKEKITVRAVRTTFSPSWAKVARYQRQPLPAQRLAITHPVPMMLQEVKYQAMRLQHHPSIVVWAGNNENEAALATNWYNTSSDFSAYKQAYVWLYVGKLRFVYCWGKSKH